MQPDGLTLGTVIADADGMVALLVALPTSLEAGERSLTFLAADGGTTTIPVDVIATTGADAGLWIGIAVLLLGLGLGASLLGYRRKKVALRS